MKDILVQSGVMVEGSVDKVLSGKMYNRTVRCCIIAYKILYYLLIKSMEGNIEIVKEKSYLSHKKS